MSRYLRTDFGRTVREDYIARRGYDGVIEKSFRAEASVAPSSGALGHPAFADLAVGERQTASMVAVFLDLTDFTGRTFWDDPAETVDLAHAVLTGFIQVIRGFGGHPLGLRGDGLFAGFSPAEAEAPQLAVVMALSACAFALDGVQEEVNPWLKSRGMVPVKARAGADFGDIAFVRTGNDQNSEVNPLGFAANFAAKCEKVANSWEVVVGQGLKQVLNADELFTRHDKSPKRYTRAGETREYHFFQHHWRSSLTHLTGVSEALAGMPTSEIYRG